MTQRLRSFSRCTLIAALPTAFLLGLAATTAPVTAHAGGILDKINDAAKKLKALSNAAASQQGQRAGAAGGTSSASAPSAGSSAPTLTGATAAGIKTDKQDLGTPPAGTRMTISPRNQHVAWAAPQGSRPTVVVDGVVGPPFDALLPSNDETVVFSDDGNHYAYLGRTGDEVSIVRDGKVIGQVPFHQRCDYKTLAFGPGGAHLYFIDYADYRIDGMGGSAHQVVMDGVPGALGATDTGGGVAFSPDGRHYAYGALELPLRRGGYTVYDGKRASFGGGQISFGPDGRVVGVLNAPNGAKVTIDGKPVLTAATVLSVHTSPAGGHLLASVMAQADGPFSLTFDGHVVGAPCRSDDALFSSDGKHYAAACEAGTGRNYVVHDGKKGREYLAVKTLQLSADGEALIYQTVMSGGQMFIVANDKEFGPYKEIVGGEIGLSNVGAHYLFTANFAPAAHKQVTIWDGREIPLEGLELRNAPTLSANGQHFVFTASKAGSGDITVLGRDGHAFAGVKPTLIEGLGRRAGVAQYAVISPDGAHVAYRSQKTPQRAAGVYLDDQLLQGVPAGGVQHVAFTPDSRHLYWYLSAQSGFLYVDDKAVLKLPRVTPFDRLNSAWQLNADGSFQFLTVTDAGAVVRYRVTPGGAS